MKRAACWSAVAAVSLWGALAWADTSPTTPGSPTLQSNPGTPPSTVTPPGGPTPDAAANQIQPSTPSVALQGETKSLPPPTPMTQSPGVFVTLTRTAVPQSDLPTTADVVRPELFQKFDAQNAGQAIARQTSIQLLPIGNIGSALTARIRGSSSNQTLILIDGRPASGYALGVPDLSEIPAEQIDHIEIVRGGVSALYGPNAIGGVINVITKRAAYKGLPISHISYEQASYDRQTYRLDFGSRYGPVDFFFFGNQAWESGFRDNSDVRQHNIGGNVGVSMGGAGKLLLDVTSYHANAGTPGLRCTVDDPYCQAFPSQPLPPNQFNNRDEKAASTPSARQITDTDAIRTSYIVGLPADMLLTLRAHAQQREVNYNDANSPNPFNASSSDRREQTKGGEAQLNLPLNLLAGGSYNFDRLDSEDRLTPANSFIKRVENWGVFAQETFKYEGFSLIPSGRYDHNSQFGDTTNPRVQAIDDLTEWLRLSGSAGRSFRAPTIDEVTPQPSFNYLGNAGLRPEKAWTYDAGFELHDTSSSFRATYFRANISDLIQTFVPQDPNDVNSAFVAVNLGRARRQGAEVQIDQTPCAYFAHSLNYTYLDNRGVLPGNPDLVQLAYSPRHTVNYLQTFRPHRLWRIDSTFRFEDSRYSANAQQGTKMGSQLLWDLRVAYEWRQMELYLGVNDVTNKRYVEQPGFPLPGTTAFGGVKLRLWG